MISIFRRRTRQARWLAVLFLIGCASMPKDRFPQVQQTVADRTGQTVFWIGHDQDQAKTDALVSRILSRPLSADDAARIALLNNRKLQAEFDELGISRADLLQAGLMQNPVLNVIPRFPDRPPSGIDIEVSVEEDFVSLLMMPARKKLAGIEYQQATLQTAHDVLELAAEARSAFYAYQAAGQMVRLEESIVQSAETAANTARQLRDAGNIADLDFAGQQAMLAQARIDLDLEENELADDRERLNELMGLGDFSAAIDPSSDEVSSKNAPDRDPSPTWSAQPDLPDLPATDLSPVEISVANLEKIASQQRLDLAAAREQVLAAAQALGISQALRFLPDGAIGIDSEKTPDGQTVTGPTISLPIPIFDTGQAKTMAARARLDEAGARYTALAVQIGAEVRRAKNHLASARTRVETFRDVLLPLHARIVDESVKQYNGMLLGVFQLLTARQNQIDAQRAEIAALRDYWIARAELARAVGGKLPANSPATFPATQVDNPPHSIHPTQEIHP
jgi:cobalt-zinc-cadmium efflux system outer membrane protein